MTSWGSRIRLSGGTKQATAWGVTGGVLLALSFGCAPGEAPEIAQARERFEAIIATDENYAAYALDLASRTDSAFAQGMLRDALTSGDPGRSSEALKALARQPSPAVSDALQQAMAESSGLAKFNAAMALAQGGDAAAVDYLVAQIEQGNPPSLPVAAVLRDQGRADVLQDVLKKMAASDDLALRNEAYGLLGEVRADWAKRMLVEGLEREFGEEREGAILAIGQTGDVALGAKLRPFINTRGLVLTTLDALGQLGDEGASREVAKMADHREALVRARVAPALFRLGAEEPAIAALQSVVEDPNLLARTLMADRLGGIEHPQAAAALQQLAQAEDPDLRLSALRALRDNGTMDAALRAGCYEDPSYQVVVLALEEAAGQADGSEIPKLVELLANDNPYVGLAAANAIFAVRERYPPEA